MSELYNIESITNGYRPIRDGSQYERFFAHPEDADRIIIEDGEVDETVDLMKKVVWKYINDTKQIASYLKGSTLRQTCENIWNFLYHHVQYKLDKKGLEQLRRPNRSWAERKTGIDCDCFSIFVSSILTNLKILHRFRITKYNRDVYQHVYVVVPIPGNSKYYTIDCVLSQFNYEKPFKQQKDFDMSLKGIDVAVLSGAADDVLDLVSGFDELEGLDGPEYDRTILEHLIKTRNMVAQNPNLIRNSDYPPAFLKMLDYAIDNWNTPNREKALEILAKNEDALNRLNGFDGSEDPEMDGLDDEFGDLDGLSGAEIEQELNGKKRPAKKKGFFKKIGQAVKKVGKAAGQAAKKVAKAVIRFNPLTISARGGFLLAMKLNIKKMASKLKWGYATKEQAAAKGISTQQWEKSKNAVAKVEKLFVDKLQGKKSALKNAVLKGKAGGLNGVDEETDISGLGVVAVATLAAAVPVITATLKILTDAGVMKKEEAQNIEAEVSAKTADAEKLANDPDIKNSGTETASSASSSGNSSSSSSGSSSSSNSSDSSDTDSSGSGGGTTGGGIIGFVKKQPLLAVGGAALGIWGLSKLFGGKKSSGQGVSGVSGRKRKKSKTKSKSHSGNSHKKGKRKLKSITLS
jgi:hypothetical protein